MRTTVRLDDDVHRAIKNLAEIRGDSFGQVLSEAARRGLQQPARIHYENAGDDLPVFEVREDSPLISSDLVRDILDDEP